MFTLIFSLSWPWNCFCVYMWLLDQLLLVESPFFFLLPMLETQLCSVDHVGNLFNLIQWKDHGNHEISCSTNSSSFIRTRTKVHVASSHLIYQHFFELHDGRPWSSQVSGSLHRLSKEYIIAFTIELSSTYLWFHFFFT